MASALSGKCQLSIHLPWVDRRLAFTISSPGWRLQQQRGWLLRLKRPLSVPGVLVMTQHRCVWVIGAPGEAVSFCTTWIFTKGTPSPWSWPLDDQQAKSLRTRMFMGSPKEPSGPFLTTPVQTAAFLCSWCQNSIPLRGVGERDEEKVGMLHLGIFRGKTGSWKSVQSSELSWERG